MKAPPQIRIIHDPDAPIERTEPPLQSWGGVLDAIRFEAAADRIARGLPIPQRLRRYVPTQEQEGSSDD